MAHKPRKTALPATVKIGGKAVDSETLIKECEDAIEKLLDEQLEEGDSFEAYEKALLEIVHEIARRKLEKKLQAIADGFADRLAIDHNTDWHGRREDTAAAYRRHCPGEVPYHSLVGA